MYEFLALLCGVVVGLVVWQVQRPRIRAIAIAVLSVTVGVLVAAISGELAESWAFALLDTVQVAVAAVVTLVVVTKVLPRTAR